MLLLEDFLKEVQLLNETKKYAEAIEMLSDEVLETHQSADLYAEKAQAFYRLGKMNLCNEFTGKALLINENHAKANHYKGNLYSDIEEYDKAIEAYNKAIEANPKYVYPYNGLGNVFYELKEYDNAIVEYNKVIEIYPEYAFPYYGLGNVFFGKKEYDRAIAAYNKAIEIDPKYAFSHCGLGNVYSELKEYDNAIEAFKRAIKIDPTIAHSYNGIGNVYKEIKEYEKAIEAFSKAIEADPNYSEAHNGIGNVYRRLKKRDQAIDAYNKAIEIDSKSAAPFYNRALAYYSLSKYSEALADYEKYYDLTKSTDDFFTRLAKSKVAELKKIIGSLEYKKISELVIKIKKLLLFQDDCVTHYTGLLVAKALIFEQSKFRLSEGAFLNDTSEGRELFKFLPDLRKCTTTNETVALPFVQKPFIGSFVSAIKHDDLTLWRMYGKENKDEARGCAITLNREIFLKNLKDSLINDGKTEITEKMDEEFSFYRVAYRKEGQEELFIIPSASIKDQKSLNDYMLDLANKVKKFLSKRRKASDIQNLLELLNSIAYLFKSAEYQYEHELRLVVESNVFKKIISLESNQPRVYIELVPICPFINKITLGPKVERAEEWAAAFYYSLGERGYHPEILISHLPFK